MPVPAALDVDLIISLTFVGISAYIMQRAMRRLDPHISNERTTKASAVARRLLKGKGKMELVLHEHEIEVAADVVCPDDIDVTFKAPWYKVEVGHYRTEAQAQTVAEKIERYYPNALKVRSQILVPRED